MAQTGTPTRMPALVGGALCLDFVNTVDPRHSDTRRDCLQSYDDLLTWGVHAGALTPAEAPRLRPRSRSADAGRAVYEEAIALREALYALLAPSRVDDARRAEALAQFNKSFARARAAERLAYDENGFRWQWEDADRPLDRVLWPVVRSAAELLTSEAHDRIRECPGYDGRCGWLFLDTTKNESRRWCSMRVCGNREKARRHYARRRGPRHTAKPTPARSR